MTTEKSILMQLLPIFLGGFLATVGGFIGQFTSSYFEIRKSNRNLRLLKAEELIKSLYEHSDWLTTKRENLLFRQKEHDVLSPISKVRTIQELYFPDLSQKMVAIMQSEVDFIKNINNEKLRQMKNMSNWLDEYNSEEFNIILQQYLLAFRAMVSSVADIVNRETSK